MKNGRESIRKQKSRTVTEKIGIVLIAVFAVIGLNTDDIYGSDGSYKGYVEDDGDIYGTDGSYKGEVEND